MLTPRLRRLFKGLFMEARVLAVLVWSTSAVTLGTALAATRRPHLDWRLYFIAVVAGLLGQGYTTHAINEIRDWTSGTDQHGLGGSKVIREGLLSIRDLWAVFWISLLGVVVFAVWCARLSGPWAYAYMGVALAAGILYSLPPFQFAYRPYLGEWLGAAPGILACVCGAYYVQTLQHGGVALLVGAGFALQCMAIMLMFHTMDYEADRQALPVKRTTIVHLGPARAQQYLLRLQQLAVACFALALLPCGRAAAPLVLQAGVCHAVFDGYDPLETRSIIRASKRVTWWTILGGLTTACLFTVRFVPMFGVVALLYAAHKRYGKLSRRRDAA